MAERNDDITRYRKGEMTPEEQHAFEKKALHDPFLADALQGAEMISEEEFSSDVSELQEKIKSKTSKGRWFWPLRIAASVALLALSYVLFNTFFNPIDPASESITMQSESKGKTSITPDSIIIPAPTENTQSENLIVDEKSAKQSAAGSRSSTKIAAAPDAAKDKKEEAKSSELLEQKELDKQIAESLEAEKRIAAQEEVRITKEEALKQEPLTKAYATKSATTSAGRTIKGKVVFAEDGKPIPGTNVLIKGTNQGTVTDMNGEYTLTTTESNPTLVYSFIGFQSAEVKAKDKSEVNVSLQTDVAQLSEVVVTGYSPQTTDAHEPVIKLAEPVGGRKAYDKYLQNSLHYPAEALENKVKGKVTVQFTVRTDGSLDEFNIIKGLGFGCDEEVIRLVKEGPQWKPTTEDDVAVESEVIVRVKFALPN